MTHDEYEKLLAQFESEKNADPAAFNKKVARFITLGYLFFGGISVFFFGLFALSVALMIFGHVNRISLYLILGAGIGSYTVIRMFFLRFPEPDGEPLTRVQAPLLFDKLAELGQKLGSPPISSVRLIDEINAYAAAVPKFFLFGKPDLNVAVGVPLMAYLQRDELDSVLAHELAHHTNRDTDVSLKVHRVASVWQILAEANGSWIDWSPFFARWYYPRISAMADVLSRDMEFEADRMAGRAAGNEVAARALIRMNFAASVRTEKLQQEIRDATDVMESPFDDRTSRMLSLSHQPIEVDMKAMEAEVRRVSLTGDSHPSLRERLDSLGVVFGSDAETLELWKSEMSKPLDETALEYYLGGTSSALVKKFDLDWVKGNEKVWTTYRNEREYNRAIIAEMDANNVPLTPREKAEYGNRLGRAGKKKEAVEYLEKCHSEMPDELPILRAFALSAIVMEDPRTEELLDRLYKVPAFRFETDEYRYGWLQHQGRTRDAEAVAKRLRDGSKDWFAVVESLMPWSAVSKAKTVQITKTELTKIKSVLAEHKCVEEAYLALMEHPDIAGLSRKVLFITINMGIFHVDADDQYAKLTSGLFEELDLWTSAEIRILPSKDANAKKAVTKLAGLRIYPVR